MSQSEKESKNVSPPDPQGGQFSPSGKLLESYMDEIGKLKNEDSQERARLYEKAAELGKLIIRGEI